MVAGINRVPTGGTDNPSARVQIANSLNSALTQLATAQANITANATATVGGDLTGNLPNPTIGANKITNAKLAQMAANTIKGNNTAGTANAADLTAAQVKALLGTGVVAQAPVVSETGAVATGTTTIPLDNTTPQNTEGNQYISATITPTNINSKLVIDVVLFGSHSAFTAIIVALFQDSGANALASGVVRATAAANITCVSFTHVMTAGTTSATTFKVRAGNNGAGTFTFNGESGAGLFNGTLASSITITEYLP